MWRASDHRRSASVVAQPLCCKNQCMGEEERWCPGSRHRSTSKSRWNYAHDHTSSVNGAEGRISQKSRPKTGNVFGLGYGQFAPSVHHNSPRKRIKQKEKQFGTETAFAKITGTEIARAKTASAKMIQCRTGWGPNDGAKNGRRNVRAQMTAPERPEKDEDSIVLDGLRGRAASQRERVPTVANPNA
uniref:Uncharacterized protein n=1 Tax=Romanomermis culicivorax TaxID=13658 RepID=A0A915JLZ7_ROMCU